MRGKLVIEEQQINRGKAGKITGMGDNKRREARNEKKGFLI